MTKGNQPTAGGTLTPEQVKDIRTGLQAISQDPTRPADVRATIAQHMADGRGIFSEAFDAPAAGCETVSPDDATLQDKSP